MIGFYDWLVCTQRYKPIADWRLLKGLSLSYSIVSSKRTKVKREVKQWKKED